ncbi:glycerate kinase type-2 family protein [Halococcus sp. AFM35]|uniref:glycerate kinase type-2 family protein n=1 Tax=Halococcus sp. AFM35 TaxID=3421653 RepID=UPI003EBB907D
MIRNREGLAKTGAHETALDCIEAGIEAAQPTRVMNEALELDGRELTVGDATVDLDGYDEVVVVGGGKAAAQMATVIEDVLGEWLTDGVVVTNDPQETSRIRVVEGSHPTPNEAGEEGARRVLSLADGATGETLVLCLISGGGSALLPAPVDGVSLAELQSLTDDLLSSGATIHEINAVRKHLSAIKGGQLAAAAAPATVHSLLVSDVVGDDPSVIASGPTVPDESTYADALAVLERYDIQPSTAVEAHLEEGVAGERPETPAAGDSVFEQARLHVLANGFTALAAARTVAEERGYTPVILSSRIEGEAREAAKTHAAIAEEARASANPVSPPAVFLSGGETTVTLRGDGTGGPNQEFVLSGALTVESAGVVVASVDTDGKDGASDVAGALADRETLDNRRQARTALATNDVSPYLVERNAVIETGKTGTNVNDLRVLVVDDTDSP